MPKKHLRILAVIAVVVAIAVPVTASGLLTAADVDDTVAGAVALPASPVQGTAHYVTDLDDVYRIDLRSGQWLYVGMTATTGADFDLHLFGPGVRSVSGTQAAVAYSENTGTSTERVLYKVKSTGTHYVDVWAFGGQGTYKLTWGYPSNQPSIEITAPAQCAWEAAPVVSGRLLDKDRKPVAGQKVAVYAKLSSASSFAKIAETTTASTGAYAVPVKPAGVTAYSVRYIGGPVYLAASSVNTTVSPRASLTRPSAPSTPRAKVNFTASGYLKPKHARGAKTVKLSCYRKEAGVWVARKIVYAANYDYSTYTRYSASFSLPYAGSWRICASVPADAQHVRTTSTYRYLTAK